MRIAGFVPIKLNSRRLPNKNFLQLGGKPLAWHVFNTMLQVEKVQTTYCYTSQPHILKLLPGPIELLHRPSYLDGDDVRANQLFEYAVNMINADIVVLVHATAPFIKAASIRAGIEAVESGEYDCALSVHRHQTYAWFKGSPLNYDPHNMAQTQQLESVFLETSGFYIFRKDAYFENNTRITGKPFFVEVDYKESIDIDYPSDFRLAQQLVEFDTNLANSDFDEYFLNVVNLFQRNGNVRHVSFDLDGVLIDSLELMKESWSYALAELEINVEFQSYKQHIGLPFLEILRALDIGKKYHDEIATRYNSYSAANVGRVKLYEDIGYELDNLKREGIKLSIITSKTRKRTSEIVDHFFGASLFDLIICPEDVPSGRGKPNPDPLLYACVKLGVDPVNTIYVGDMEPDRECANRAGASFVFANWGYGNLDSSKEVWFNGISDLCSYLLSD